MSVLLFIQNLSVLDKSRKIPKRRSCRLVRKDRNFQKNLAKSKTFSFDLFVAKYLSNMTDPFCHYIFTSPYFFLHFRRIVSFVSKFLFGFSARKDASEFMTFLFVKYVP